MPVPSPVTLQLTLVDLPPLADDNPERKADLAPMLQWLSADEVARIERTRMPGLAVRQSIVRLCLRAELGIRCGVSPQSLRFDYGPKGKPALFNQALNFNLSHSGDRLLIASTPDNPLLLGVDIERRREKTDIDAIYRHYFSLPEQQYLEGLQGDAKRDAFFDLWALKESFIKATGNGLAEGLKSFGYDLASAGTTDADGLRGMRTGLEVLRFGAPSDEAVGAVGADGCWQSAIGQLDGPYRLAYTIATPVPRNCQISLTRLRWQALLQQGREQASAK